MIEYLELGDMTVTGMTAPPGKLLKALAVVAANMHPAFDQIIVAGSRSSRVSCVLTSLTVRDFLRRIGFKAQVEPVYAWVRALDVNGDEVHSVGVGDHSAIPGQKTMLTDHNNWAGHMVVVVDGWMIDTTVYQMQWREYWPSLPGMISTPWGEEDTRLVLREHDDTLVTMRWLPQPHNKSWRSGHDTAKGKRIRVVDLMVEHFGKMA